eukprot:TRINITY_DN5148_c0_g1_i1.p1 TRINITY_DN5148_c0_g1~~TRINITY_DN5148_c0_g1_i1.p1  ORF type:complete len:784 (+),score=162.78 TRINITY_DN5148_c0_g1_i1:31-2382(+)
MHSILSLRLSSKIQCKSLFSTRKQLSLSSITCLPYSFFSINGTRSFSSSLKNKNSLSHHIHDVNNNNYIQPSCKKKETINHNQHEEEVHFNDNDNHARNQSFQKNSSRSPPNYQLLSKEHMKRNLSYQGYKHIYNEVMKDLPYAMKDKKGSVLVFHLIDRMPTNMMTKFVGIACLNIEDICSNEHSSFCFDKLVSKLKIFEHMETIRSSLKGKIPRLACNFYGSRRIQYILDTFPFSDVNFILEEVFHPDRFAMLSCNQYGTYLVQNCIRVANEHAKNQLKSFLTPEQLFELIKENEETLMKSIHGMFVVREALAYFPSEMRAEMSNAEASLSHFFQSHKGKEKDRISDSAFKEIDSSSTFVTGLMEDEELLKSKWLQLVSTSKGRTEVVLLLNSSSSPKSVVNALLENDHLSDMIEDGTKRDLFNEIVRRCDDDTRTSILTAIAKNACLDEKTFSAIVALTHSSMTLNQHQMIRKMSLGHVEEFLATKSGSKLLERILMSVKTEELLQYIYDYILNPEKFLKICLNEHGSFVVEQCITFASKSQISQLQHLLQRNLNDLWTTHIGSHVVQHFVEKAPLSNQKFIFESIFNSSNFFQIASNKHAHFVVLSCIRRSCNAEEKELLSDEDLLNLVKNRITMFANHRNRVSVIRAIIQHYPITFTHNLFPEILQPDNFKAIFGNEDGTQLLAHLCDSPNIWSYLFSEIFHEKRFLKLAFQSEGSALISRCIQGLSERGEKDRLKASKMITVHHHLLSNNEYGKTILDAFQSQMFFPNSLLKNKQAQ